MALEENTSAESGISRRTIVKGAAWAAPVMIAAVAVPAAVASPSVSPTSASWSNGSSASKTFRISPAPANGTVVSLHITGTGWSFNANNTLSDTTAQVTNGAFSVTIYPGQKGVAGTLSVVGVATLISLIRT